jgi:hypothetical protein
LAGHKCEFDPVTMAEFLRTGTSTHPHTYWQGITHLDAGTHYRFPYGAKPRLAERSVYWRPAYCDPQPSLDRGELVARLADALQAAVRRRTQARLGSVAVMLSAGADSRCALFAARDPAQATCYTLYDEENPELEGARRLALAAGARHIALKRGPDYYIENAADAVRLSSGMWSIESAHFGGMVDIIRMGQPGVLLAGNYAHYLFKGLALNRQHHRIFGRALPLFQVSDFQHQFYLPFCPIGTEWTKRVEERLDARFFDDGCTPRDVCKTEYSRLAPLAREGDASTDLCLWRLLPYDPMMLDRDLLDVYGRMSVRDKLCGIPYGMAVARVVGSAGVAVPNNNYGAKIGSDKFGRVAGFLWASFKRKLRRSKHPFELDSSSVATLAAWPCLPRIVELSAGLRDWLANLPVGQAELLFDMVGEERRAWSMGDWACRDTTLVLRMIGSLVASPTRRRHWRHLGSSTMSRAIASPLANSMIARPSISKSSLSPPSDDSAEDAFGLTKKAPTDADLVRTFGFEVSPKQRSPGAG